VYDYVTMCECVFDIVGTRRPRVTETQTQRCETKVMSGGMDRRTVTIN
jgi:hypothetical protein